jgi:hypothetical protein
MQLGPLTGKKNQWTEVPGWHVAGDWVDTLSLQGNTQVLVRPFDFVGPMVLHCHITSHADAGILGIINVIAAGVDANQLQYINDYGTCAQQIPFSTPLGGTATPLPGIIEAENFDEGGEGIAYHNLNFDTLTGPAARFDEAVEIVQIKKVVAVSTIRKSEWMRYTVNIEQTAAYSLSMNLSSLDPVDGMAFSLWLDQTECPPAYQTNNRLTQVAAPDFSGTGSYQKFLDIDFPDILTLQAGQHTLLICFDVDASMLLNSMTIELCGPSAQQCPKRESSPLLNLP